MKCREKGVKLNKKKLELCCTEIPFMGHLITSEGLKANPGKVEAAIKMPKPQDVKDIRKLCGFVNYLAKFIPRLSAVIEPLRQLTHKEAGWKWMHEHDAAFEKIKSMVTTTPVLKYYNPEEELTIQYDASEKRKESSTPTERTTCRFRKSCSYRYRNKICANRKGNVISSVCVPQVRPVCLWEKSDYRE